MSEMHALVTYIAKSLVDAPDEVEVRDGESHDGTPSLILQVAEADRGKVIGKKGRVAYSMRTLLAAAHGAPMGLDIVD